MSQGGVGIEVAEIVERIAQRLAAFATNRSGDRQAERIEGRERAIAVGVCQLLGLQDPVVMQCLDGVAERVAGFSGKEVVLVIRKAVMRKRIAKAPRQEEVAGGFYQLIGGGGSLGGMEEHAPGRNPPAAIAIEIDIAATVGGKAVVRQKNRAGIGQQIFRRQAGVRSLVNRI